MTDKNAQKDWDQILTEWQGDWEKTATETLKSNNLLKEGQSSIKYILQTKSTTFVRKPFGAKSTIAFVWKLDITHGLILYKFTLHEHHCYYVMKGYPQRCEWKTIPYAYGGQTYCIHANTFSAKYETLPHQFLSQMTRKMMKNKPIIFKYILQDYQQLIVKRLQHHLLIIDLCKMIVDKMGFDV